MADKDSEKQRIVSFFLERKILLDDDLIEKMMEENVDTLYNEVINKIKSSNFLILNEDLKEMLKKKAGLDLNWLEMEKAMVMHEKKDNASMYNKFIDYLNEKEMSRDNVQIKPKDELQRKVKVIQSYDEESKKKDVQDFILYFNQRFSAIEKMLSQRQELQNINSISRVLTKKNKENVSVVGMILDKKTTKNNNIMITLEDSTGIITILVSKGKPELYDFAKNLVLDDIIGVNGTNSDKIIFANNIILPDIPIRELKKCDDDVYAIFLSDLHVGSTLFLGDLFDRFLNWINGGAGSEEHRQIAEKVKYIFIVGDLIDGVGVYPGQEDELAIKDVYAQYNECARLLSKIPNRISVIICPGNHDAIRIAEPQPVLYRDFAKAIWDIPNVFMVSNPSLINIHADENFSGFNILLYHGYSFDYFIANVDSIRNQGGYDRADLIMKFLLQRRHLAPTHTATLYIPDSTRDPLVINTVPDFFVTGHIHKSYVSSYKNITLICGSCWQSKTPFQEKVGHHPEPAKVPIVNLSTRKVKVLKF